MDVTLARSFLEVVASGSFVAAAARLNVTQAAISLRIANLERQLGKPLFLRGKAGISLTPDGRRFHRYAAGFVALWEQAQHALDLPPDFDDLLIVGAEAGLWNRLLYPWTGWLRAAQPKVALKVAHGPPPQLVRQVLDGTLDVAVLYTVAASAGLVVDVLLEEDLILAATPGHGGIDDAAYVHIEWGAEFQVAHRRHYPAFVTSGFTATLGTLGLRRVLDAGGSGYFPYSMIKPELASGALRRLDDAPVFKLPVYVCHREPGLLDAARTPLIAEAMRGLDVLARRVMDEAASGRIVP